MSRRQRSGIAWRIEVGDAPMRCSPVFELRPGSVERRVCTYVYLHSRVHEDIDTSNNRDRLNSQRHMLVQATVTTQLRYHTCELPQGNGQATKPAISAAGPPIPATRVTATSVHKAPASRRQDGVDSRCNTTTNRSRPKRCATVPAGKTDPMSARSMYSVKAPAGKSTGCA